MTIASCVYVINGEQGNIFVLQAQRILRRILICIHKERSYDPYTNGSTLQAQWISQASERQRRGRAGRCQQVPSPTLE